MSFLLFYYTMLLLATEGSTAMIYNQRCIGCIDVDVYFHIVAHDNGTIFFQNNAATVESITPMIEENMRVVNYELNETPFVFNWINRDYIPILSNTSWTSAMCRSRLELNNHSYLGDSKSINVYLGHRMHPTLPYVGCASFPSYQDNGVWVSFEVLPPASTGLTMVHEFGHWFGLQHTFATFANADRQDKCNPVNRGDFVDDTPIQLVFDIDSYTNDTTSVDSCPDQPGEDAFWNLMNYACRRHYCFGDRAYITEGQIQRMVSAGRNLKLTSTPTASLRLIDGSRVSTRFGCSIVRMQKFATTINFCSASTFPHNNGMMKLSSLTEPDERSMT